MGALNMMQGQKAAAKTHCKGLATAGEGEQAAGGHEAASTAERIEEILIETGWIPQPVDEMNKGFLDKMQSLDDKDTKQLSARERKFNMIMGVAILANTVWIAIEIDFGPEEGTPVGDRTFWMAINTIFLSVFLLEILVRLHWERSKWIKELWNWFDLLVLAMGIFDVWILTFLESEFGSMQALSTLRLARLVRLVRMIKLVKNLNGLYVMVMAFIHALQSMVFLAGMMFFGMMIYAIFATILIGKNSDFDDVRIVDDTVDDRFGKVYRSMYSLFELMTLEGWEAVCRPLVERQPLVFIFIGSFILIFTYGMLNMVVATVVEKTLDQSNMMKDLNHKQDMVHVMEKLVIMKDMFVHPDGEKKEGVTKKEFIQTILENDGMMEALRDSGVPTQNLDELFTVLDMNCDGQVDVVGLFRGIESIRSDHVSPWTHMVTYAAVRSIQQSIQKQVDPPQGVQEDALVLRQEQLPRYESTHDGSRLDVVERRLVEQQEAIKRCDRKLDEQTELLRTLLSRVNDMRVDNPGPPEATLLQWLPPNRMHPTDVAPHMSFSAGQSSQKMWPVR